MFCFIRFDFGTDIILVNVFFCQFYFGTDFISVNTFYFCQFYFGTDIISVNVFLPILFRHCFYSGEHVFFAKILFRHRFYFGGHIFFYESSILNQERQVKMASFITLRYIIIFQNEGITNSHLNKKFDIGSFGRLNPHCGLPTYPNKGLSLNVVHFLVLLRIVFFQVHCIP